MVWPTVFTSRQNSRRYSSESNRMTSSRNHLKKLGFTSEKVDGPRLPHSRKTCRLWRCSSSALFAGWAWALPSETGPRTDPPPAARRPASAAREEVAERDEVAAWGAVDLRDAASARRGSVRPRGEAGLWDFGDGFFLSFMAGEMIPDSGGKVNENMLRTEFSRHGHYTTLLVLVHFSFSPDLSLLADRSRRLACADGNMRYYHEKIWVMTAIGL